MAYRQLCAVTFAVLGWVTVGCGSGGGPNASPDAIDEHPPGNRDQPTNNATDRAPRSEQAPTNPDQPPHDTGGLPSQGGGGDAEGQCRALCDSVEGKDCTGAGKLTAAIRAVCQSGCVLSTQQRLCASEIGAVVGCLNSLSGLCTDAFDDDQDACDASFQAVDACEEANQPDNQGACNLAGGCTCETACETCGCNAGTNAQALAACVMGACAL